MSTAQKNTTEENTMSQNELKNKTGPTFIDTVSATKLQMERWMGKQDEEERVKSGRLTLTLLIFIHSNDVSAENLVLDRVIIPYLIYFSFFSHHRPAS